MRFDIIGHWAELSNRSNLSDLVGYTLVSAVTTGPSGQDDELILTTTNGWVFRLYHNQDCCESVYIEDICGDLNDLVGSHILMADESSEDGSTWTFYRFATIKGSVTVRFLGTSNGYYCHVDLEVSPLDPST